MQVGKSVQTLPKKILPLKGNILFYVAFHFSYTSLFFNIIVTCYFLSEVTQLRIRVFFMLAESLLDSKMQDDKAHYRKSRFCLCHRHNHQLIDTLFGKLPPQK